MRRHPLIRIIFVAPLLFAIAACNGSTLRQTAESARAARAAIAIEHRQGEINGLNIGSSEAAVLAVFGRPLRSAESWDEVEGKPAREIFYDGIEIYLVGDRIYTLHCRSPRCVTHDGITLGDPKDKVRALLGQGSSVKEETTTESLIYPFINADINLIIEFRDGRVTGLILHFDYV